MVAVRNSMKVMSAAAGLAFLIVVTLRIGFASNTYLADPVFLISAALTIFSFAATVLFLMGLGNFKRTVRRAYGFLSAGIAIYAIGQMSLAFVKLFPAVANYVAVPYVVSIVFIFMGMGRLARVMQLKTWSMSPLWAYGVSILVGFLVTLVPHTANPMPEIAFDITNAMATWSWAMLIFTTVTVARIRSVIAPYYRASLGWMMAGLLALAGSGILFVATAIVLPVNNGYFDTAWQLVLILLSSFLFMWAGHSFVEINARPSRVSTQTQATPMAVITYVAGLASDPRDIDQQLDVLRSITSQLDSQHPQLSPAQEAQLTQLYKALEHYLVTGERLQNFTPEGLRESVSTRFQFPQQTASSFWSLFAG